MIRRFFAHLRRRGRDRAGVAAVEFALIAPLLITLLGAAVDLGNAIDRSIRLENAARTGAQYATRAPGDTAGAQAAALAVLTAIPGWSDASVTVSAMACTCLGANGAGTGTPNAGTCGTCPGTSGEARYVTVTATRPFTPIFPTSSFIPFNNLGATSRNVVARM